MKPYKREFKESIDQYNDVFNISDNEFKKVKKIFDELGVDFSKIERAHKKGIMSLFDKDPAMETFLFVNLISIIKHNLL